MTRTTETVDEAVTALASFIDGEVAATTMALGALRTLAQQVVSAMPADMQPGETLLVGANVPGVGWIPRFDNIAAARSYAAEVAPTGATSRRLTQQLIVSIHTGWEHQYRRRIAMARHLADPNEVRADFFRDISRLRNDIVHHHGVATAKNAGKCTTLMRTLGAGDPGRPRPAEHQVPSSMGQPKPRILSALTELRSVITRTVQGPNI